MSDVVAVVGLGYGPPLAVEFDKQFATIDYELSAAKIASYRRFCDVTDEVSSEALRAAACLTPTTDPSNLRQANFIVVAEPTPVDVAHIPDFDPMISSATMVGRHIEEGRDRHLQVHRVPRCHRRGLCSGARTAFWFQMEAGFSRRLFA